MGADYRGLGIVRSLGRHGIPVWLIKEGGHLVAAASRHVCRRLSWPAENDRARIDFLLDLAAQNDLEGWLLFPTDDYTVALISQHHEVLADRYRITVPPWEELRWACDKRLLFRLAGELGIPRPWTVWLSSRQELAALDCPFPVILKPAMRARPSSLSVPKAWRADDRPSLLARYDEACRQVAPENLVVQEVVPGGGEVQFSFAALCRNGDSLASLVARRTRQYPSDFGQLSTYVETVDDPQVAELGASLLSALRFTGLAEVEFKKDPRNGQYKILDVNPRVWGWHTLSRRAGIDLPYLLWLLLGENPVPELRGRTGERWMHLSADLPVAFQEIRNGKLSLRAYFTSLLGPLEGAIFAWDDPLPGLLDLPLFAGMRVLKFLRGSGPDGMSRSLRPPRSAL